MLARRLVWAMVFNCGGADEGNAAVTMLKASDPRAAMDSHALELSIGDPRRDVRPNAR
jgi:hypothetical protein